jgi:hypothetical protein
MSTESKAEKAHREALDEALAIARTNHLAKHVPLDGAPRYGSSQTWPKRPLTREDRVPAFLAEVIGVWYGGFEGRDNRRQIFEYGVWNPRSGGVGNR